LAQQTVLQKPSRLEQAQARLDSALAKLEVVAGEHADQAPAGTVDDGRTRELEAEVEALTERNRSLSQTNDQIGERLDAVIARLKAAVGA